MRLWFALATISSFPAVMEGYLLKNGHELKLRLSDEKYLSVNSRPVILLAFAHDIIILIFY